MPLNSPPMQGSSKIPANTQSQDSNTYSFQTQLDQTLAINYQQNILDQFDLPTYHFKFFMVGPDAQTAGTYLDPSNQVIIAESAISDYTIDEVEIESTCQQSYENGTGTSNLFKFKVTEPAGAALLDKMFYSALDLGIGNWIKSPFYLELSFRARNPDNSLPTGFGVGSSSNTGITGKLSQLRWVWPIQVTGVKANVTKVGTTYDFTGAIYNEFAFNNITSTVQHNIVLEDVRTVGDAINLLQKKLNQDSSENLLIGYTVPDVFEFITEPDILKLSVVPNNNNKNSSRANSYNDLEKKTFTFNQGTSIDKMIDSILMTTSYFQEKIKNSKTPESDEDIAPDALQQIWRIIPYSVPYKYDKGRQSNAHYIRYFIIKYDRGNLPPKATQDNDISDPYGKKRYNTYKKAGILRKKYDYIFTGLNDQVYEFNIEFNNGWAVPSTRFGGLYYNTSHNDPGIVQQDDIDKQADALKAASKYISMFNDSKISDKDKETARSNYENKAKAARLTPEQQAGVDRYLAQAKNPDRALNEAKTITSVNAGQASVNTVPKFVSDQQRLTQEQITQRADKIYSKYGIDTSSVPVIRPVSSTSAPTETEGSYGIEDKASPARNYTSALFAQAMSQTAGGDLANIKLKIKGDPYWLQPAPFTTLDVVAPPPTLDNIKVKLESTANFNVSTNFFLVRLRTPRLFQETGANVNDPFTEVDTISALYSANIVHSHFVRGVFYQELEGTIDPPVEISKFLNEIENEQINEGQSAILRSDIQSQSIIPDSAIKNIPDITNPNDLESQGISSQLRDSFGNNLNPGNSIGKTQLNNIQNSVPGIDTNAINSIGQRGIPGLPDNSNLSKAIQASLTKAKKGN